MYGFKWKLYWYFHFPRKRCSQVFRDYDFSKSSFDSQHQMWGSLEIRKYNWIIKISKYHIIREQHNMFFWKSPGVVDDPKLSCSLYIHLRKLPTPPNTLLNWSIILRSRIMKIHFCAFSLKLVIKGFFELSNLID